MKVVVFDPQLNIFGHHISFNNSILKLFSEENIEVIYMDYSNIIACETPSNSVNIHFVQIDKSVYTNGLELCEFLKKQENAELIWDLIAMQKPDVVLMTAEGKYRHSLFTSIPENLSNKIACIIHAAWSFKGTLNKSPEIYENLKAKGVTLLVLAPWLIAEFNSYSLKTYWFPFKSYSKNFYECFKDRSLLHDRSVFKIGTIGVINERRNNHFLLDSVSQVKEKNITYVLAGQLMPVVAEEIKCSIENFKSNCSIELITEFGYLSDEVFKNLLDDLDFGLLGYDSARNSQASGAVYSYTESFVPLMVPDTALFSKYHEDFPNLFFLYNKRSSESLIELISNIKNIAKDDDYAELYRQDQKRFFMANAIEFHKKYIDLLFKSIALNKTLDIYGLEAELISNKNYYAAVALNKALMYINKEFASYYSRIAEIYEMADDSKIAEYYKARAIAEEPISIDSALPLENDKKIKIFVYPTFLDSEKAFEFLLRLSWHMSPHLNVIDEIVITINEDFNDDLDVKPYLFSNLKRYYNAMKQKFMFINEEALKDYNISEFDMSFVHHYESPEERTRPFKEPYLGILESKPIWFVDETRERFATSFFLKAGSSLLDTDKIRKTSHELLLKHFKRFKNKRIAVFGTGPSVSTAFKKNFKNVDTIAANSMVVNEKLLDHIKPKLFVCADPIFHAGCSTYAEDFRIQLRRVLKKYNLPLVVPERDYHIYHSYFFSDNIDLIGIPFEAKDEPNFNLKDDFYVATTGNILTLFLLPLAFSNARNVDIYGCDGRKLSDNKYFWDHDKHTQINDKMNDIQHAHVGFFNVSYDDYYNEHCNVLEKWLAYAESLEKRPVSRSFSYIDALARRERKSFINYFMTKFKSIFYSEPTD